MAVLTRQGSGRPVNQDRVVVNGAVADSERATTAMFTAGLPGLVAVLDGLGGHPAGDVAAARAAEVMASGSSDVESERDLVSLVEEANRSLYGMMSAYPALRDMGTTIAGVLVSPETLTVFHVGDSRVYLHTGGHLTQLTADDWSRGYVTQTLGGWSTFQPIRVHTATEPLGTGRILAATDGVFGQADRPALSEAMNGALRSVPDQLLQVAVASGNTDDFSVAVIEPHAPEP